MDTNEEWVAKFNLTVNWKSLIISFADFQS